MFTVTTNVHPDDTDRTVIVATSDTQGLIRYSWTWTNGTPQIAIADRAGETPFDTIGVYDHETGRIVIDDATSLIQFLTARYTDHTEVEALEATWQASLY